MGRRLDSSARLSPAGLEPEELNDDEAEELSGDLVEEQSDDQAEESAGGAASLISVRIPRRRLQRPARVQAQPTLAATAPAPAAKPIQASADILTYWGELRRGRPFPSRRDLDPQKIMAFWPNTMLLRNRAGHTRLSPETLFATPPGGGAQGEGARAALELSSAVVEWIHSLASNAVRSRRPIQDTDVFPSSRGESRYQAIVLPLSDDQTSIDHVLCHVRSAR